jgi:hypothetical protein
VFARLGIAFPTVDETAFGSGYEGRDAFVVRVGDDLAPVGRGDARRCVGAGREGWVEVRFVVCFC